VSEFQVDVGMILPRSGHQSMIIFVDVISPDFISIRIFIVSVFLIVSGQDEGTIKSVCRLLPFFPDHNHRRSSYFKNLIAGR
jgi:hypothetical protein